MTRKSILCIISAALITVTVALCGISSFAAGSHGLYMDVDTAVANYKTNGFMIDFYTDSTDALYTYWENVGFAFNVANSTKQLYPGLTGGGGYAGLQMRGNVDDRVGIMALWKYTYRDKTTRKMTELNADRIFPSGSSSFGGEGTGVNCIYAYPWKTGQWYRELLYTWVDAETGFCFAGTWYYDYTADKWTLFCYFNTKLVDTWFKGGFGQFIENYVDVSNKCYRMAKYKNTYVLAHETNEWISAPRVTLHSDSNPLCIGEVKIGASESLDYVWCEVDGSSEIDTDVGFSRSYTLSQDAKPTVGKPSVATLTSINMEIADSEKTKIAWSLSDNSTPQLSYRLVVTDTEGNELINKYETRPEVNNVVVDKLPTDAVKCDLTVTDVFGQTTSTTYTSEEYTAELNADKEAIAEKEQELRAFVETMNGKLSSGKYSEESIAVITEAIADVNAFLADESKRSEADITAVTAVVDSAVAAEQSGLVKGVDGKTIAIVASACALFLVAAVVVVVLVVRKKKKA